MSTKASIHALKEAETVIRVSIKEPDTPLSLRQFYRYINDKLNGYIKEIEELSS